MHHTSAAWSVPQAQERIENHNTSVFTISLFLIIYDAFQRSFSPTLSSKKHATLKFDSFRSNPGESVGSDSLLQQKKYKNSDRGEMVKDKIIS